MYIIALKFEVYIGTVLNILIIMKIYLQLHIRKHFKSLWKINLVDLVSKIYALLINDVKLLLNKYLIDIDPDTCKETHYKKD